MRDFNQEERERAERRLARMKSLILHPAFFGLFACGVSNVTIRVLVQILEMAGNGRVSFLILGPWAVLISLLVGICVGTARFVYVRSRG